MAFSFTKTVEQPMGSMRMTMGTFTNGSGDTGGNIRTGLTKVASIQLQPKGSSVLSNMCVVNGTFPREDPVTIVTDDNADGYWMAIGW